VSAVRMGRSRPEGQGHAVGGMAAEH
jgi:hypothetical protein